MKIYRNRQKSICAIKHFNQIKCWDETWLSELLSGWDLSGISARVTWTERSVAPAQSPHCSNTHYPGLHRDNLSSPYWTRALKAFISGSSISASRRGRAKRTKLLIRTNLCRCVGAAERSTITALLFCYSQFVQKIRREDCHNALWVILNRCHKNNIWISESIEKVSVKRVCRYEWQRISAGHKYSSQSQVLLLLLLPFKVSM